MQYMRIFQLHHLKDNGDTMEENETEEHETENDTIPVATRIDITPDLKETAWKVAKGLLDFSTKAVFYIPGRKDHVVMKALKGGALLHSAYSAWKNNKDGESDDNEAPGAEKINSVSESCRSEQ